MNTTCNATDDKNNNIQPVAYASPTSILLQDIINMPTKTEMLLTQLTTEQIRMIEDTINRVKRRKLEKSTVQESTTADNNQDHATAIASALAKAMIQAPTPPPTTTATTTENKEAADPHELVAEVRDGVEWVSFVYSHNRVLKRYTIRTDVHNVCIDDLDKQFKDDNCVYPRANLPKETYRGNRWAYETECNMLGWKLAWLNKEEIAGKRGLIQRAVDSYRNRYPSMRSRRVARQEKLLKGTLRKRKAREEEPCTATPASSSATPPSTLDVAIKKPANHPKTIAMEDPVTGARFRIKINVEGMNVDEIPVEFRRANCVFPRIMEASQSQYATNQTRWLEESLCNELGWKLAWLNQRHLAGKKNLLQRTLDTFRTRFMPTLQPRKHSSRTPPVAPPTQSPSSSCPSSSNSNSNNNNTSNSLVLPVSMPLTASALSAQNAWYAKQYGDTVDYKDPSSSSMSCTSGTTASLDFGDCFSLADEPSSSSPDDSSPPPYSPSTFASCCDHNNSRLSPCCCGDESSSASSSSCSSSAGACTPSSSTLFGVPDIDTLDSFTLPPASDIFGSSSFADPVTTTNPLKNKLYDPVLASPSLPSSAVQQQDLVVKMEDDDMLLPPPAFGDEMDQLLNYF